MKPPLPLTHTTRKAPLIAILALAFLPFGVPRWLNHDDAPPRADAGANFATLCRDHGGTPSGRPGKPACSVRYGRHVYLMDAITPHGFDHDTARYQRQGCQEAQQRQTGPRHQRQTYTYHPTTGVCEHQP